LPTAIKQGIEFGVKEETAGRAPKRIVSEEF
jgi:hypothetical protein